MGVGGRLKQVALVAFVVLLAPFVVFALPATVGADASYVVLSDSMEPTFAAGDAIVVNEVPAERIERGDIITFESDTGVDEANRITHRVVGTVEEDGTRKFRTKGDANEEADKNLVTPAELEGRVMFSIPLIGHLVTFAGTDAGLVLLVIVPSVLLLVSEVYDLARAALGDGEQQPDGTEEA